VIVEELASSSRAQALLWLAARAAVVASLAIPGWGKVSGDMVLFRGWIEGFAIGASPTGDKWQYPPGVALLFFLLGVTGLGLAGLVLCVLAADAAIFAALRGTPGGLFWGLTPLLVGPVFLLRMDTIVTAFAVLGILANRRWIRAGLLLGAGAAMKLWPPLLLAGYPRRDAIRRAVVAISVFAAVAIAARQIGDPGFLGNQATRGLQIESLAAYPFMVALALGADVPLEVRSGAAEIVTPLADTVATLLLPLSIALLIGLAVWGWRTVQTSAPSLVAPRAVVIVCMLLLTSRVLSPQFNIWIAGLVAVVLAVPGARLPRIGLVAACVTMVAAQALYPHVYLNFAAGGVLGLGVQTIRLTALVVLFVVALRSCVGEAPSRGAAADRTRAGMSQP
jgi:hypothetical protein